MYDLKLPCDAGPECEHQACKHCDRPIRPSNQNIEDHPGTIRGILARKECVSCYRRGGPPQPVEDRCCVECEILIRPNDVNLEDAPGTKKHAGRGLCTTCYTRMQRHGMTSSQKVADKQERDREIARAKHRAQQARFRARQQAALDAQRDEEWLEHVKSQDVNAWYFITQRRERKRRQQGAR